jgi:hypothetical protein
LTEAHTPKLLTKVRGQIRPAPVEPEQPKFYAQPIPSTLYQPSQLKKMPPKPATENDPVLLNTEKRMVQRKEFEDNLSRKQVMMTELARQHEFENKVWCVWWWY